MRRFGNTWDLRCWREPVRRAPLPLNYGLPAKLLPGLLLLLVLGCIDPQVDIRVGAATVDSCTGVPDDAACDDLNPCTSAKKCKAEVCVGTPPTRRHAVHGRKPVHKG